MNIGIQKGTTAYDEHSKRLDANLKTISKELAQSKSIQELGYTYERKLNGEMIPGGTAACEPDGGCWFLNGKLVAVIEGKKQNNRGNAIERWFKNYVVVTSINPDANYITFLTGDGAARDGKMTKLLSMVHVKDDRYPLIERRAGGFNKFVRNGNTCYLKVEDFTYEELKRKIRRALKQIAE
jgi:hypothetical protein